MENTPLLHKSDWLRCPFLPTMELQNIQRIAVFKMRNIGDVLVTTPLLRALRETWPHAKITAIVNSGTEAMLAHNPHIDETLVYQRDGGLRGELRLLNDLRRRRFDLTIGLTEGDRTAWYSLWCHAPVRMGITYYKWRKRDVRRLAYTHPATALGPEWHEVERHFLLLEQAGLKLRNTKPGNLCLVVPEDLRAWARKELAPLRPGKIVHIHPVSRWLWKCWGNEAMAEIIDWLQTERGARVVLTTGPVARELDKAREIVALCRTKPLFHDGKLSLTQIAALLAESDGYFGVDTAPMHMAAAVGVPVVALFGPTNARNWGPWTPLGHVLSRECPCIGNVYQSCDWTKVRGCLAAITVPDVQAALDAMLASPKLVPS